MKTQKNLVFAVLFAAAAVLCLLTACEQPFGSTQTVATPTATPAGGDYTSEQSVTLETATEGADIHYTLDGTTPTASSTLYSSAITISATTTLKAIAVKSGMTDSDILTENYTITVPTFTVTYDADGGTPAPTSPVTMNLGDTVAQPSAMTKNWHTFDKWYTDSAYTVPAVFPITVNDNVNLYARWSLNPFTSVADVSGYLASLPANTVDSPARLVINIDLGTMTQAGSGWQQLLDAVNTAGKYVDIDLSACTMTGTSFNPDSSVATGKDRIVSLVLPAAAESIEAGTLSTSTFKSFTNLTSVSGANITAIGDCAFDSTYSTNGNRKLQSVDFPQVTSIGNYAFYYCTNLQSISLPQAANIGYAAFTSCTNLQSVNFPQATSIGNSAFSDCKGLQSVDFPLVTTIGSKAFWSCTGLQSLNIPQVTNIGSSAFSYTGTAALVITMGSSAPTLDYNIFNYIYASGLTPGAKTVTVKVPAGATGYTPFSGSTVTVNSGTDANWANGLRGGGWTGTTWPMYGGGVDEINQNISLIIQQQ